jgi:hypothetical protein
MARKTPILIRRGGLTGDYFALTRYRDVGGGIIEATVDGKHDVTADVEAIVAERCRPLVEEVEHVARRLYGRDITLSAAADRLTAALAAFRGETGDG